MNVKLKNIPGDAYRAEPALVLSGLVRPFSGFAESPKSIILTPYMRYMERL